MILLRGDGTPQPILLKGVFDIKKHRGRITVWLIALLTFIIVGNYICILVMEWNGKKPESLNNAFNASLPVVSGFVGSAIAYYFTKSKETR
ncbi:MAG: hypothetical protein M3Y27_29090 [Acidobacteriota bacterium]|nr:hypothetical protein [Acidobacteriota bacterium]